MRPFYIPFSKLFRYIVISSCVTMATFIVLVKIGYITTEYSLLNVVNTPQESSLFDSDSTDMLTNRSSSNKALCRSSVASKFCKESLFVKTETAVQNNIEGILESYIVKNVDNSEPAPKIDLNTYNEHKQFFSRQKFVNIINCRSIFDNNRIEIKRAIAISKGYTKNEIMPNDYIRMTQNCGKFIKDRGYITDSLTEEEEHFPIAYSILMFKAVEQTERLLRAIYRPQNIYCIHVDTKANPYQYRAVSGIASCFDNVFVSPRVNVTWGQFTVLAPELLCMQELEKRNKKWKYFINLTGQEFPLKTTADIVAILKAYNGSNDVNSYMAMDHEQLRRLEGAGDPPHGAVALKGMVHMAATRGFVHYILHDQRALDILQWATNTLHSEEIYFATIQGNRHLNVPGGQSAVRSPRIRYAARYKVWFGGSSCQGKYSKKLCIFGIGDLPILASRFELFANKFRLHYQPLAYDCLEEYIYNRTRDQYFGKIKFDSSDYSDGGYSVK